MCFWHDLSGAVRLFEKNVLILPFGLRVSTGNFHKQIAWFIRLMKLYLCIRNSVDL